MLCKHLFKHSNIFVKFIFVCMVILPAGIFVHHVHTWWSGRLGENIVSLRTVVTNSCVLFWLLEMDHWSCGRGASALNSRAISPATKMLFLLFLKMYECVCLLGACLGSWKSEDGVRYPRIWVSGSRELSCGCWEPESRTSFFFFLHIYKL